MKIQPFPNKTNWFCVIPPPCSFALQAFDKCVSYWDLQLVQQIEELFPHFNIYLQETLTGYITSLVPPSPSGSLVTVDWRYRWVVLLKTSLHRWATCTIKNLPFSSIFMRGWFLWLFRSFTAPKLVHEDSTIGLSITSPVLNNLLETDPSYWRTANALLYFKGSIG